MHNCFFPVLLFRSLSTVYLEKGPQRIGKQYKKAVYVEYTDGTFRKRTPKNGPDRGIMGPVLRGETGDEFQVTMLYVFYAEFLQKSLN